MARKLRRLLSTANFYYMARGQNVEHLDALAMPRKTHVAISKSENYKT